MIVSSSSEAPWRSSRYCVVTQWGVKGCHAAAFSHSLAIKVVIQLYYHPVWRWWSSRYCIVIRCGIGGRQAKYISIQWGIAGRPATVSSPVRYCRSSRYWTVTSEILQVVTLLDRHQWDIAGRHATVSSPVSHCRSSRYWTVTSESLQVVTLAVSSPVRH